MIKNLQSFILKESQSLQKIDSESRKQTFMEILGVSHKELQHSNFLSWLFSPTESHNINDFFLRGFINLLDIHPTKQIFLNLADLSDTKVIREKDNIDIFLVNEKLKFSICIENKIWSGLGEHQLSKYYQITEDKFSDDYLKVYVYLSPFVRLIPIENQSNYINIIYSDISNLLKETLRFNDLPNEYLTMINDYLNNLDKNILGQTTEIELAQAIYKKHKRAIDYIWRHRPNFRTIFNDINVFFQNHEEYENLTPNDKRIIRILPKKIINKFKYPFNSWGGTESMFALELFCEDERIIMTFCFGGIWGYENLPDEHQKYQEIKNKYFEKMKSFKSISKYIRLKSKPTSNYPYIATKEIIQIDSSIIFESDSLFDAFKKAFGDFETTTLNYWTEEVNENI